MQRWLEFGATCQHCAHGRNCLCVVSLHVEWNSNGWNIQCSAVVIIPSAVMLWSWNCKEISWYCTTWRFWLGCTSLYQDLLVFEIYCYSIRIQNTSRHIYRSPFIIQFIIYSLTDIINIVVKWTKLIRAETVVHNFNLLKSFVKEVVGFSHKITVWIRLIYRSAFYTKAANECETTRAISLHLAGQRIMPISAAVQ